ncbi:MAG: hypothetical protein MUD08_14505, partial [Cytophagales bacterium]|nr:hypothetical protein [Cytophagales bacterium]
FKISENGRKKRFVMLSEAKPRRIVVSLRSTSGQRVANLRNSRVPKAEFLPSVGMTNYTFAKS